MRSSCTQRTVICSTSSSRRSPTGAPTPTVAAPRTACACLWRLRARSAPWSRARSRWARASRAPIGRTAGSWWRTPSSSRALKAEGVGYVCVSSGGNLSHAKIPLGPGYQVPFAAKVRAATGLATRAVGLIASPEQAEAIVAEGQADFVALARAFLDDPRWVWHAAERLGAQISYPPQYARVSRANWPGAELVRP